MFSMLFSLFYYLDGILINWLCFRSYSATAAFVVAASMQNKIYQLSLVDVEAKSSLLLASIIYIFLLLSIWNSN